MLWIRVSSDIPQSCHLHQLTWPENTNRPVILLFYGVLKSTPVFDLVQMTRSCTYLQDISPALDNKSAIPSRIDSSLLVEEDNSPYYDPAYFIQLAWGDPE